MSDLRDRIGQLSPARLKLLALQQQQRIEELEAASGGADVHEPIAICGLSCRFPGGVVDGASYWKLLDGGVDAIAETPAERWSLEEYYDPDREAPGKIATRWGGYVAGVDRFDPAFFGITPREAVTMDPQQRLLLEVGWEALEDARVAPDRLRGSSVGVFIGQCNGDYFRHVMRCGDELMDMYLATGSAPSVASGRLSYVLGLNGPSVTIDTACSSSLVALVLAIRSLRVGDCDRALAGGVNLTLTPDTTVALSKAGMMAPDGRCKAFDARADGFVRSEGCGLVVLKRLADAEADGDPIRAVIRGAAINQDGRSSGLTAPNGPSQVAVIRAALADGKLEPADIDYVEAHGTGTSLGDPIEIQALGKALGAGREGKLATGSAKTNLGHCESAAGIAGLLKALLMLEHRRIPPHLHLESPNPHIPWDELPVEVPTDGRDWESTRPRRAGVSSFGFSGTNAHVILEEAPARNEQTARSEGCSWLGISAHTPEALAELTGRYVERLERPGTSLADVAHSASVTRARHPHRRAVVATDARSAAAELRSTLEPIAGVARRAPKVAFLFTGHGAQQVGMGKGLYERWPVYRDAVDRCERAMRERFDRSILEVIFAERGDDPRIHEMAEAQPALFALEWGLSELWRSRGVQPTVVAGHSLGEYVAAATAGVFSVEDALSLVVERSRLMGQCTTGAMGSVLADRERVERAIGDRGDVSVAAINGPESIVISGEASAVEAVLVALESDGVKAKRLAISTAAHSPMMEPYLAAFREAAKRVEYSRPQLTVISNITGAELAPDEVTDPDYWVRHMRQPVQFHAGMQAVARSCGVLLELGPANTLIGMARLSLDDDAHACVASLPGGGEIPDDEAIARASAALFVAGVEVEPDDGAIVDLPHTVWTRERYWAEEPKRHVTHGGAHPLLGQAVDSPLFDGTLYTSRLAPDWPRWIADHKLFDRIVVPSPVYLEMLLEASERTLGKGVAIERFEIERALQLSDPEGTEIQLVERAGEIEIFGRDGDEAWQRRARARVVSDRSDPPPALDREAIDKRCDEAIDGASYYRSIAELGLNFGPDFRGVRSVRRRDGEAIARLVLPDDLRGDARHYRIHPALLDACFHTLGAPLPSGDEPVPYLLIGIDRLRLWRRPQGEVVVHVTVEPAVGESFRGEMTLHDADGQAFGRIEGLTLKRVRREALERMLARPGEEWGYRIEWRESPLPDGSLRLPEPASIRAEAEPDDRAALARYAELAPQLDAAVDNFVREALDAKAVEKFRPLAERLRGQLDEKPAPAVDLDELRRRFPEFTAEIDLCAACGPELAGVLEGRVDPLELLFPGGSFERVEPLYHDSPSARVHNAIVAEIVAQAAAARDGRLRVLEIGAGSGGTTARVLPRLDAERASYLFTDVTAHFTDRARERFDVETAVLDIESDEPVARGPFDVIVAANVLHATADLEAVVARVRDRLAPGGWLVLLEGVRQERWVDLTFGMTEGWWKFRDGKLERDEPLLAFEAWKRLLNRSGFDGVVEHVAPESAATGQAVIVARNATRRKLTVLGDGQGLAAAIERLAEARGYECVPEAGTRIDLRALDLDLSDRAAAERQAATFALESARTDDRWIVTAADGARAGWGILRVAALERPEASGGAIELDAVDQAAALLDAIGAGDGEDQLALHDGVRHVARLAPTSLPSGEFQARGSWLISGGLGGVGLHVARWLAERGAPHVILQGRSALPDEATDDESRRRIEGVRACEQAGAKVDVVAFDIGDADAVAALFAEHPRIEGVLHAAVAMSEHPLDTLDDAALDSMFRAKVDGAWALHRAAVDVKHFVLFSSTTALIGVQGLAHYAAANVALDALAEARRAEGLPALSVDWGTWAEMRVASEEEQAAFARFGLRPMALDAALGQLGALLADPDAPATVAVADIDWTKLKLAYEARRPRPLLAELGGVVERASEEATVVDAFVAELAGTAPERREALLRKHVGAAAAAVLRARPGSLDEERGLFEIGMDSLMAVELKNRLQQPTGRELPATLCFNYPTIADLAAYLLAEVYDEATLGAGGDSLADRLAGAGDRGEQLLVDAVREQAARVLGMARPERLDVGRGLFEMGMDSLMAVELKKRLEKATALSLPSTLTFNYPTIEALAGYLHDALGGEKCSETVAPEPEPEAADLEELSEDDLAAALERKLSRLESS